MSEAERIAGVYRDRANRRGGSRWDLRNKGELYTVTVILPLARRLGPLTAAGYPLLASIPPMRSHLLGLLVKGASDAI